MLVLSASNNAQAPLPLHSKSAGFHDAEKEEPFATAVPAGAAVHAHSAGSVHIRLCPYQSPLAKMVFLSEEAHRDQSYHPYGQQFVIGMIQCAVKAWPPSCSFGPKAGRPAG